MMVPHLARPEAMYLARAKPSTKAARQLRRCFAAAGAPVMILGVI